MKTWRTLLLALAASLATFLPAAAADLGGAERRRAPPPPPPPAYEEAPFTWSGIYVGAHLGYGWSNVDWQEVPPFNGSHDGSGGLVGAQIGYNWQAGRFVYGIEADITNSMVEGGRGCCDHSIDWLYSVRGRLGLTGYDNRTLFYVTGGGAWADIDYASVGGHSAMQFGWVIGGGVERALTQNLTARVEYLYYDFGSENTSGPLVPGSNVNLDTTMHTVRFGLNYKF